MSLKSAPSRLKRGLAKFVKERKVAVFVLAFALVGGSILLLATHAASPYASSQAESGILNTATIVNDVNASGGSYVKFGSGTITTINPPTSWSNVTSNLAGMASECGNLTMLSPVPNSNTVLAGVAASGLWSSNNSGASWTKLDTGAGADPITNRPSDIVYDPTNASTFWEAGIYGSTFGVLKTTDGGTTFHGLGSTFHDDGVAVDFTDINRQTLLAGGHETAKRIDKSTNGGQTWTNIWSSLPSTVGNSFTTNPIIINTQTYLINANVSYAGGNPGIYRTTNGGTSWTQVSTLGPQGAPLITSNGTIYWSLGGSLAKSTDNGQTWIQVGSGLSGINPTQLPDGRLLSVGGNTLVVSADGGQTWTSFGAALPYSPADAIYSSGAKAFFISHWDCGSVVLPDAIERGQ